MQLGGLIGEETDLLPDRPWRLHQGVMEPAWGEGLVCPPLPALWEVPGMTRNARPVSKALVLPEGTDYLPGTLEGLRGPTRGSHGGFLMPEKVRYPSGKGIRAWYCHFYKTEREHYHITHELLEECGRLYP